MAQYICMDCGWVYDEALGLPERGIAAGTKWESLPDNFQCGECDVCKSDTHMWQKVEVTTT
ncbi:MAG: rubredoxin [Candidatus Paceibacterota bacterium]|jgi:rubredoxin